MANKRSWIFLRGLVRGRGHWADFPERFRQRFPQDEIEIIDLPGNGERGSELSPLHIQDYIPLVRNQSQALQRGEKIHLLSLSLGGMVGIEWMQRHPEDFEKLFVVCTSSNQSPFYQRFLLPNYVEVFRLLKARTPLESELIMLKLLVNNETRKKEVLSCLVDYTAQYPVNRKNFPRQLLAASHFRLPAQPPGPVQILGTWGDHLVSPQCTLALAKYWNLKAKMHPSAGHDIPIDDPDWLLDQLA